MSLMLLGILNSQAAGGALPYFQNVSSASSLPNYGEIGSGGTGSKAYYFAFYTSYTNGFFYSADGINWSTTPNPPSFLQNKSVAYAGYPHHMVIGGTDVYLTGVNDNSSAGHWAMWYDNSNPSAATNRYGNITYSTGGQLYGHRIYESHAGTLVSTVWKDSSTVYCHRLQNSSGGSNFTLSISGSGYPQYDPYGQYVPKAVSQFSYIGPNSWYWNRIIGGSTSANANVYTGTYAIDFGASQHTYFRLANGIKYLGATNVGHNAGYVYSGGLDPADGWTSNAPKFQSPTGGSMSRPVILDDNQTCVFFRNSGQDIYVTTDLQTFTLYEGLGTDSPYASAVVPMKRSGTTKYILWGDSSAQKTANDTLV